MCGNGDHPAEGLPIGIGCVNFGDLDQLSFGMAFSQTDIAADTVIPVSTDGVAIVRRKGKANLEFRGIFGTEFQISHFYINGHLQQFT